MGTAAQSELLFPKERVFSDAECSRRLAAVRKRMAESGLETLLLFDPSNICYLAGHQSVNLWDYQCLVVPLDGDPFLILWAFEQGRFQASSWLKKVFCCGTHDDPIAFTARALDEEKLASTRLGIELGSRYLPARIYQQLRAALDASAWADGSGLVESVRVRKSDEEIKILRRAAAITSSALSAALARVAEGARDLDVAAEASRALITGGSEFTCIEPIVAAGHRAGLAHSSYNGTPIRRGDPVFIELGACVHRYTAPLMRTATAGSAAPELQALADHSLRALDSLLEAIRPGVRACDVAEKGLAAIAPIESTIAFHYVFGYSVGVGFPPSWLEESNFFLRADNPRPLEAGMVFHLPMTLRVFGRYGAGFSETVLVTPNGREVLTNVQRKLVVR